MNIPELVQKYGLAPRGVIQVGSHHGEEVPLWRSMGIEQIHFEPVRSNYTKMMAEFPELPIFPVALSQQCGVFKMYCETVNGGQSCSLLKPKRHLEILPWIRFDTEEAVVSMTLDSFNIRHPFNFLYIDAQGSELGVMMGGALTIDSCIDFIVTEVNRAEVFEGCATIEDIDRFLAFKFDRVETEWHGGEFGDALYVRR